MKSTASARTSTVVSSPMRSEADSKQALPSSRPSIAPAPGCSGASSPPGTGRGEDLSTLHGILAANRAAHHRPAGLPRDYLERARAAFPDRVAGAPVAAAVVYRVLDDVDLLVAWGDAGHELRHSPMDRLAHLLVMASMQRGARLLDLGPSSEKDGTPNVGLVNFKRSVGAIPGTRKVFTRAVG
jgi:hypothetical protein